MALRLSRHAPFLRRSARAGWLNQVLTWNCHFFFQCPLGMTLLWRTIVGRYLVQQQHTKPDADIHMPERRITVLGELDPTAAVAARISWVNFAAKWGRSWLNQGARWSI